MYFNIIPRDEANTSSNKQKQSTTSILKSNQKIKNENPTSKPKQLLQFIAHMLFPLIILSSIPLTIILLTNLTTLPFILIYLIYIYFDQRPYKGTSMSPLLKQFQFWTWYTDYFNLNIIFTSQLNPSQTYLFGYHLHGILALGAFSTFITNPNLPLELKNFTIKLAMVDFNFWLPFSRELYLWLGAISCSKKALLKFFNGKSLLENNNNNQGKIGIVALGGAEEALYAVPNTLNLILNKRKGFIKLALQTGAHLVPVINLGENELANQYQPKKGSILYQFQYSLKKWLGFTLPFYYGVGPFPFLIGYMPRRVPLVTLIGKPITVIKIEQPNEEQINELHQLYIDELKKLYYENVKKYYPESFGKIPELKIIA